MSRFRYAQAPLAGSAALFWLVTGVPGGAGAAQDGGDGGTGAATVTITHFQDLCAGNQNEVFGAAGVPKGGVYAWSVSQPSGQLDTTTGSGPRFYFSPVKPSEMEDDVEVQVTYTAPGGGTASDTVKVTVFDMEAVVHRPKVIDPAETAVPIDSDFRPGVQTFVNLDNDDKDGSFDTGDADTEVAGEDEMIKMVLQVRPKVLSKGEVRVRATKGGTSVKLWKKATKEDEYTLDTAIPIGDFQDGSAAKEFELWIEGTTAHNSQQGTQLEIEFKEGATTCKDDVAVTVIGVARLFFRGKKNGHTDDGKHTSNVLDGDPNWTVPLIEGQRVFPGGRKPDFGVARDVVPVSYTHLTLPTIDSV